VLSVARLLNLIYFWVVRGASQEQRVEFDEALIEAGRLDLAASPEPPQPHVPGTAPAWIRKPSWWKGDRAAFRSSVSAAEQLGELGAAGAADELGRRSPPRIGSGR